jgi:4-hydroxy-3-methylbut-2-enyl diphosphate reductase
VQVVRAKASGMCFGVRDAIDLASAHVEAAPLTILGDLVHNATVLDDLRTRGIAVTPDITGVETGTVMITAHGTSDRARVQLRSHDLPVVDATCPLVDVAHRAVRSLVRDGYHPVIIGQRAHVEVRGLVGDLDAFDVVMDEADVLALAEHPRIGVAAQTTQPIDRVRRLVARIRERFPKSDVRFLDTVCRPTKQRQDAALDLARRSDVVVVIGGATSNNTRELVNTCRQWCRLVHHVQTASDLRPEWFIGADVVGLTAGTSTPDQIIEEVHRCLLAMAAERHEAALGAGGLDR